MPSAGHSGTASGGQLEEKVDLSKEVDAKIPQAETLCKAGQVREALALLAALEKKCRVGNDTTSLVRVCETSLQLCKDANDLEALLTTLKTLSTRRSQKSAAVRALVHKALPWCIQDGHVPLSTVTTDKEKEDRNKLVEALRDITDGKIFLEAERARLTRALATIKEVDYDDIAGAALLMQDVHVETYGSISKKEKIEFILEQIRLTLAKKDFVRAAIVAGKISKKNLAEETMQEYKVRYYTLLAEYHLHEKDSLELAKDYHAIYLTPIILSSGGSDGDDGDDSNKWKSALEMAVLYLALSPYSMDQQNMLHLIEADANLEKLPAAQATIQLLLKKEIISYPMSHQAQVEALIPTTEDTTYWKDILHRRIIQHNIRTVASYYKRIRGTRLAQLLGLEKTRLEEEVSSMVSDGSVYAKMDRPQDIIRFSAPKTPETVLSEWATDIDKLLGLVETTTHLIQKENMMAQ